ncbi:hypothetical protein ABNIH10_11665, partial [Acinetobacter baumannii ABNIH10]
ALNNPDEVDRKMLAPKNTSGCRRFRLIQIYLYKKGSFGFLFYWLTEKYSLNEQLSHDSCVKND